MDRLRPGSAGDIGRSARSARRLVRGHGDVAPEVDYFDYYSVSNHGTVVSGVIAAVGNNGIGVCGVNWQCSIMALRVGLDFTTAQVAEGLDYATANGARVVNMSFGTDIVTTDLGGQYISAAGTSFSSPYMAAVAALLLAHRPELTLIQARAILENTTDPIYYGDGALPLGFRSDGRCVELWRLEY